MTNQLLDWVVTRSESATGQNSAVRRCLSARYLRPLAIVHYADYIVHRLEHENRCPAILDALQALGGVLPVLLFASPKQD